MRHVSVCSGIEAASVAWAPLGWKPVAFSEIEPFPCAVLERHYPDVPNLGDLNRHREWPDLGSIDVLVGGTPCQSFSVAGLRGGMADPRGNLALVYLALADRLRPRWLVWENVPGVLSSSGGRDFGAFLGGLAELGYGFAWRVLDAQYAGLAQRRKRVFLVGHSGGCWQRAAAVLLERASLRGDPAPSREAGEGVTYDVAPSLGASGRDFERAGETRGQDPVVAMALNAHGGSGRLDAESETLSPIQEVGKRTQSGGSGQNGCGIGSDGDPMFTLQAQAQHAIAFNGRMDPVHGPTAGALDTDPLSQCVAFPQAFSNQGAEVGMSPTLYQQPMAVAFSCKDHGGDAGKIAPTLRSMSHSGSHANAGGQVAVAFQESQSGCREYAEAGSLRAHGPGHDPVGTRVRDGMAVRRLTPTECERLQGFPDGYTQVPFRGKPAADGPRYKALGNSIAVPVLRWVGSRMAEVDAVQDATASASVGSGQLSSAIKIATAGA